MSKIRVYELARELKIESKLLVNKLKDLGIEVASHQSTLSADQILKIKRELSGDAASRAPKTGPSVIRRRRGPADEGATATPERPEEDLEASESEVGLPVDEEPTEESVPAALTASESEPSDTDEAAEAAEDSGLEVAEESVALAAQEPAPELKPIHAPASAAAPVPDKPLDSPKPLSAAQTEEASAREPQLPPLDVPSPRTTETITRSAARPDSRPASHSSASESRSMPRPQEGYETAKIVRREPPSPQSPSPSQVIAKAPQPGGATIVRRVGPSEDGEPRRMSASPSPIKIGGGGSGGGVIQRGGTGGFPSSRPPSHEGGPRRTGEMIRGGGISKPHEVEVPAELVSGKAAWREDGLKVKDKEKDKKRTFLNTETDEPVLKRQPKQRRDQVNLRSLLNQADAIDEDLGEVEAPEVVEADDKKRTVYMPQAPHRRKDIKRRKDLKKTQLTTPRASYRIVKMGQEITVGELAKQLSIKATDIIKKLMSQGVMATINQPLDFDTATLLAAEYNFEVKSNIVSIEDILTEKRKAHEGAELVERPPIVTIMGHVDHGKTSILDAIRKAKVAASEAGGITQHIGAYTVEKDGRQIAFLDTPGHEAFSSMRARGAKVTDIVVLVVAADDGVMPQTVEAISHARAANVPIIVAINKIDKPNKNFDRIHAELAEHGIQSEDWGGENQFVRVSALQGIGIDDLLEAILLQSEVLELKTPLDVPASGVVVEAHLDKGRGPVATIMVQKGILTVGDHVVAGSKIGRVRAMHDHTGKRVKEAGPSTPVEVVGLSEVPMAGDQVDAVEDEKTSREVAQWRKDIELRQSQGRSSAASLDQLLAKVKEAGTPEVPVIIKADTQGSVEAIAEAISKLNSERVRNRIVHKAVGGINESDIALAATSGSVLFGFNVRAARGLDDLAEKQGILIKYFSVIYEIVDTLKSVMAGKLPPIQKEVIQGHAEVRQTIKVPKVGIVAGTSVLDGKITRNSQLRLIRNDVVIYSGKIGSLRRFKDDVREVMQGYECGIGIEGFTDIREGDVIETYIIEEHAPAL